MKVFIANVLIRPYTFLQFKKFCKICSQSKFKKLKNPSQKNLEEINSYIVDDKNKNSERRSNI